MVGLLLPGGRASAEAAVLEKVTFATDWLAQAEQGGFFQALATGLYERRGLAVELRPGGPMVNVQQWIATGVVDLGIGSNGFFVPNLVKAGAPVRAVMASFQKDPQIIMCHPRPDVKRLADLKGKPVLLSRDALTTFWPWLKVRFGFTDAQIRPYTFNLAPFLTNPEVVQQGYLGSEPFQVLRQTGVPPRVFLLADEGYLSYGGMVMAQQQLIDQRPQVVQAFVDATIEGWASYLHGDPRPGNALIKHYNPEMTDDQLAFGVAQLSERGIVDGGDAQTLGIGAMTDERWRTFLKGIIGDGLYPADLPLTNGYTLKFVNRGPTPLPAVP